MLTFSEQVATGAIWALTMIGCFFGGRAAWRRRRQRVTEEKKPGRD